MRAALPLAACLLLAIPAAANDVDVVVGAKVYTGQQPTFTVKVNKDLKSATLDVKAQGASHRQTLGPQPAGGELVFKLPHKAVGVLKWTGELAVEFDDGTNGTMPVKFATEVAGAITFKVLSDKEEIVRDNKVRLTMNRPAGKVDVEVTGDDGKLIANQAKKFAGEAPGTELEVGWVPSSTAQILKVKLVVHDTDGLFSPAWEMVPWSLDIPHDEVNFATGKADILPTEEPKLTAVLPDVQKAVARYGKIVPVKLYILGHTDTVGGSASNRELSRARALSIAKWFRGKGVKVPTYACGLGEDDLKVDTADETDEAKNRRADYVLHVEPPTGTASCPRVD
jgi:outer membrane protein OmpA-like peptidoglycan-associated protein